VDAGTEGEGWRIVRLASFTAREECEPIDERIPTADWLWGSLQRHCVPECCGFDAYDFSHESVRFACGDDTPMLSRRIISDWWRAKDPGDPLGVAVQLTSLSAWLRESSATGVSSALFNEILTPVSYAELFEDLAYKLANPLSDRR
jgi:Family of unknown function (DUF6331)